MTQALMNTGDVCRRLGINVTTDLLKDLGFTPAEQNKRALMWRQSDYPAMCQAVGKYIANRHDVPMQPKPEKKPKDPPPQASPTPGTAVVPKGDPHEIDDDEL